MKKRLAVILVAVVLFLFILLRPPVNQEDPPVSSAEPSSSSSSFIGTSSTQTSSSVTTAPSTQATKPTTAPTEKPKPPVYSQNPKVAAFINERLNTWTCPVKAAFEEVVGSRTFASSRGGGKRAHAGLDFVAPHGTKVYAITSGTVQRVAIFYSSTWAVEVKNDDGSILRYCKIATNLKSGDRVEQGEIIGTIMRADSGTEMLHMEVYYGDGEGMLTQTGNKSYWYVDESKNFLRRSDLLDPTFLKDLPKSK